MTAVRRRFELIRFIRIPSGAVMNNFKLQELASFGQSRRGFLRTAGVALTAGLAAQLTSIREGVACEAQRVSQAGDELQELARQYSLTDGVNYLNHAAIGTMPKPVQTALTEYLSICESNPWLHIWGDAWVEPLANVRDLAAQVLGCTSQEVAITHNTTETFNTLALGLPLAESDEVLFSSLNHAGASSPFAERAKQGRFRVRRFDFPILLLPGITADEIVQAHAEAIGPNTRLLVFPHIDNTLGVRHPVKAIATMARERGVEFIAVDAAQTAGMIPLNCPEMNIDVLATSGHKWLGGPKGTGLAYIHEKLHKSLQPWSVTWGQARWSSSARRYEDYGTRNMAEVLALGDAIAFNQAISADKRETRLRELWQHTRDLVAAANKLQWQSPDDWELAGSVYSIATNQPVAELAQSLFSRHGIVVRPFTSLGLNALRVSPNVFTAKSQIEELITVIG